MKKGQIRLISGASEKLGRALLSKCLNEGIADIRGLGEVELHSIIMFINSQK